MNFHFAQPYWLAAGGISCLLVAWFFRKIALYRQRKLFQFVSPVLAEQLLSNVSVRKQQVKNILFLIIIFLCFAALARPQCGHEWIEVKQKGRDLLFAIDTSRSMLAEDIQPNRLERAKLAVFDFVKKLPGDRVGLLPFAGSSYLMCPLTADYEIFFQNLASIDTTIIPKGGTNLPAVIADAKQVLRETSNSYRILILLTDGENFEGDALRAAEAAYQNNLTIYPVGIGTEEGDLIPLHGEQQDFVQDTSGNFVHSKLDTPLLVQLAEKTNGIYAPLGKTGTGLETIYQHLSSLPKTEQTERRKQVPLEQFHWPLGGAFLLCLLELLLDSYHPARRRPYENKHVQPKKFLAEKKKFLVLFCMLPFFPFSNSHASSGEKAFIHGDYKQAEKIYQKNMEKNPDNPVAQYNYGTATYKNQKFDEAIQAFTRALKGEDLSLQEKAYFNRGKGYYAKGKKSRQTDLNATIEAWKKALHSFQAAMELNPKNVGARENYHRVKKELDKLQREQKEQKKNEETSSQNKDAGKKNTQDQQQTAGKQHKTTTGEKNEKKEGRGEETQLPSKTTSSAEQTPGKKEEEPASLSTRPSTQRRKKPLHAQGKMAEEEANQLLDMLKDEENMLRFLPAPQNYENEPTHNW